MRKLIHPCQCGQRMQVPRSAIGRTGMCPSCGATLRIRADNAQVETPGQSKRGLITAESHMRSSMNGGGPPENAKRRFARAVDLYCEHRHAESLAVFNELVREFPGNSDIESGRVKCMAALHRTSPLALEDLSTMDGSELNEDTVRKVVLQKLLKSPREDVQLQAAALAVKILGMDVHTPESASKADSNSEPADSDEQVSEGDSAPNDEEVEQRNHRVYGPRTAYSPPGFIDV